MLVTKLKKITAAVLAVGLLGAGAIVGFRPAVGEEPTPTKAVEPAKAVAAAAADDKKLQGRWLLVEVQGHLPKPWQRTVGDEPMLVIEGDQMWDDPRTDEKPTPGRFQLDAGKNPKRIDFTTDGVKTPRNSGGAINRLGIYTLDDDKLTICFSSVDPPRPELRPTDFTWKPNDGRVVMTYERVKEFRPDGRNEFLRADGASIAVFHDANRPAYVPPASKPGPKAQELVSSFAGFDATTLTADRDLLTKNAGSVRVGGKDFSSGKPLADFYTVAIYPRAGLLKEEAPGRRPATYPPTTKRLADVVKQFGPPTHREWFGGKFVTANGLGAGGEFLWWGEHGVRADANGEVTHVLLRNPFGKPAEKRPALADVVKEWTPTLAGAKVRTAGTTLTGATGRTPRIASHVLEIAGASFADVWNDFAKKCGTDQRFAENTYLGDFTAGGAGKPSRQIVEQPTRPGERVTSFTYGPAGYTVAVTLQPKGDARTILCTLVVVMDE